jgi:maltose O-acetyltransferase
MWTDYARVRHVPHIERRLMTYTAAMSDSRFEPDGRSNRERMLAGDPYIADDPDLLREANRAAVLTAHFNAAAGDDHAGRDRILRELLGSVGEGTVIRPPFRCDYGYRTHIGARTFANWGLIALDVGLITIGDDVQIGPNVQLLTATHPLEPEPRRAKWEGSMPITLGNNVWLGGGVVVCPGVTIGDNTVVGAGAVVVRNLPADVVAVGNPGPHHETVVSRTRARPPARPNVRSAKIFGKSLTCEACALYGPPRPQIVFATRLSITSSQRAIAPPLRTGRGVAERESRRIGRWQVRCSRPVRFIPCP